MPEPHKLTVFVLCYGDFPALARRCLGSLAKHDAPYQIRVFLNECSPETTDYVHELRTKMPDLFPVLYEAEKNVYKYPAMRRMFHDIEYPIRTPYTAWFDDDSYITVSPAEWAQVASRMTPRSMRGDIWFQRLTGSQADWIRDQPWYGNKPVLNNHRVRFATGGGWVIDTDIIHQYGWPVADIRHRGGDVMLGELCRQQDISLVSDTQGVAVNADDKGQRSKSPRRGFDEQPVGYNYHRRVASQLPLDVSAAIRRTAGEPPRQPPEKPVAATPFTLDL
jgi:hypothetical protein